ncbi:MAG: Crp/Fnr family transcriptional regulator [Sulfuricaulis sp.]|uniref:Crp/Fnr family transcriptional regulator n=1 Tax=Sulfuricaulis sp. TaxID=2003553 RepID=UPI0025D923C5|nr:Crp/Fnr family transcriptional regulator [Sulfuricaulis sp.]MCR4347821.1 Crp/Fnr family transcriptional regulator [Sulfuricaulis sp.]
MKRGSKSLKQQRHDGHADADPAPVCAQCQSAGDASTAPCSCEKQDCQYCEAKLYAGLSGKQVNEIRGRLSHCQSGPRRMLFRAGDPSTHLYVIREGQVKLTRTDIDGRDHLLNLVGPGYFLGFDTIGNPSYSYNAETLTPIVLCRIKHSDIVRLLTEEPRVSLNVLLAVNEQLAQARNLIRVLGQKTAVEKVAALLLNLYPPKTDGGTGKVIVLHLSRQEMAEILGLTVETVSRIMAELRRKNIIHAPRGRIVISSHARLRALADGSPRASLSKSEARSRRQSAPSPGKPHSRRKRGESQNLRLS